MPAGAPHIVSPRRLSAVVFIAGIGALSVEICASRLLAPFFGASTIVWANIIGLILVYLSAGYWLGGRMADRHPDPKRLGTLITAAAACIAVLPFVAKPFLSLAVHAFTSVSVGAVIASFVSTLLLFAVPVTLLGMVSPFAIRLGIRDVDTAGAVSGRLYALSTMGSILGTFLPALVTIPLLGTQRTMLGSAFLLAIAAALLVPRRGAVAALVIALLFVVPPGAIKEEPGLIAETESAYQYIDVVQQPSGERDLQLNEGVVYHSVYRPGSTLTGGEWDMFLVVPALLDHPVHRVLILGNAGGTSARQYAQFYPGAHVDGVEIDPSVTDVARRYLGMSDAANLTVETADARTFLETTATTYDVIIVDAYRQPYIPFYLATQEFFHLCRDHLTAGGVLALNVERVPNDETLARTIESTLASQLPDAWTWPALKFNELVIGINTDGGTRPHVQGVMAPPIAILGRLFETQLRSAGTSESPMTDDRAPIEWLTDRSLLSYIAGGGRLDEPGLPDG